MQRSILAPPRAAGLATLVASLVAACASQPSGAPAIPAHGVIGVTSEQLDPQYWIARQPSASRIVFEADAISAQNGRLQELDPSLHDVENLPTPLPGPQVRQWIEELGAPPDSVIYDENGAEVAQERLNELQLSLDLDRVPAVQAPRFGLVVRRADLRTFPTHLRVFRTRGDTDIDRFQETALFPGTPVAVVHESADSKWWFVASPNYAAWIEKQFVALGTAEEVFGYTRKSPFVVVTGATATTVFARERPEVSQLQLDMGVRVPLVTARDASKPVNGQHPYAAHVIELPIRAPDGSLQFAPALLPRTDDVSDHYLPLSKANLLRQSFKFLGERYGWGHAYNGRDCSGFVSDVYRSFGVQLPRNTRDQAFSPALNRVELDPATSEGAASRQAALRELQVGDLVYIPGHVMMVIGRDHGSAYVIHDTTGISYRDAQGALRRVTLNGVSVTPLDPLLVDERPIAENITSIVRIRPRVP